MEEYNNYDKGNLLRNRYRKQHDLRKGSYGLVSVAKDTLNHDKLVAIKYIYPLEKANKVQEEREKSAKSVKGVKSVVAATTAAAAAAAAAAATTTASGYSSSSSTNSSTPNSSTSSSSSGNSRPLQLNTIEHTQSILQTLYDEAAKEIAIHKILGHHPNITTLYDHFGSCLVLEYCSRGDLYDAMHDGEGPLTSQDIKDVFCQVLDALEFCHDNNVFHRDLKPENILIGEDWSIKLCDWGLATTTRLIYARSEFDVGSERYMAPELFDQLVEYYDALKIDLWSIGIILLTLVFHKNPFQVANYSDKRFIQFVTNREALFDIFPNMSGEMFSVLRFCLNIDPMNRDIYKLRGELESLRWFTMDEEYWEEEREGEKEYEEEEEEEGVERGSSQEDSHEDSHPEEQEEEEEEVDPEELKVTPIDVAPPTIVEPHHAHFDEELLSHVEALPMHAHFEISLSHVANGYSMPHNHRADALLSKNSLLLPIPIVESSGAYNNFRTTRKPFGVASYNQTKQQSYGNGGAKFNREDFFTPKSVFNHYMDKYGDSHGLNNGQNGGGRNPQRSTKWKKGNKRRSWKKATIDNDNYDTRRSSRSAASTHQRDYYKKKAALFSHGMRPRKLIFGSYNNNPTNNNVFHSPVQQLHGPTGGNSVGNATSGKYIPPFLRSPGQGPGQPNLLNEDIASLHLDDEVFHLEDDFDMSGGEQSHGNHGHQSASSSSSLYALPGDGFKKPISFKVPTYSLATPNTPTSNFSENSSNRAGVHAVPPNRRSRRNSVGIAPARPINSASSSVTNNPLQDLTPGGKYVPPFRRGSHTPGICTKPKTGTSTVEDKRKSIHDIRRDVAAMFDTTSSSVPTGKTDWFSFKKDWGDYDDED